MHRFYKWEVRHAMQGHMEIHRLVRGQKAGERARILIGVSVGKARQGRVNSLRLVSLNHFSACKLRT